MVQSLLGVARAPRNIVFGAGQRAGLAGYAAPLGTRALVVTDERLAADPDFAAMIDALKRAGLVVSVYSGTVAELPAECIDAAHAAGRAAGADLIVGIGGGSCIDAAKLVSVLLAHGGRPSDYYGEFKVPGPVLPLVAVPTTAGTGSEATPVAVVSDPERTLKVGIASPHLIPHTAICDPELTYSCPPGLTASSGADALTHAIEALTTAPRAPDPQITHEHVFIGKNALSDHFASLAIGHIAASLKAAYDDGDDHEARGRLMFGSLAAGLAFGTAGTAAAHAVQYPVGALTHTPHGVGVAVMMPYVMAYNLDFATDSMADVGRAMGAGEAGMDAPERARAAIEAVAGLFASVGIPLSLEALGIEESQIGWIAEQALSAARLVKNNPRPLDPDAMRELVTAAFSGDRALLMKAR